MQGREVEVRDDANSVKKVREMKLKSQGKGKLSRPSVSPHRAQTCKKCVVILFVLFIWTRVGRPTFNALSSSPSEISMDSALHMDPNYAKNLEIFKNFEYENIDSLFNVMNMMIAGNSEKKSYSLKIPRTHRGRDPHCPLIKQ